MTRLLVALKIELAKYGKTTIKTKISLGLINQSNLTTAYLFTKLVGARLGIY